VTSLPALRWHAARLGSYFFRFGALPLVRRLAAGTPRPFVLKRRFHGQRLAIDVSRTDTHRLLFIEGERFVLEAEILRELLSPGMCVVDVGANIGYYALLFSSVVGPAGKVTCLEPDPENLVELRHNLALNGLSNVSLLPIAAGSRDSVVSMRRGLNARVVAEGGNLSVDVKRLDSLGLERVDLIKLDVEGYECDVLEGARKLLEKHRPSLFVEVHPNLLPSRDKLRWIADFLGELYGSVTAYRQRYATSVLEKARQRYTKLGSVESSDDPNAWIEAAIAAPRTEPFWLVTRKQGPS
jgi:FkbM family methyltransferase